jgi:hypothetical protein
MKCYPNCESKELSELSKKDITATRTTKKVRKVL